MSVNEISYTSHLLNIGIINDNELYHLSYATGFIYKHNNIQYLVTNLHVLSGRDIFTGEIESKTGGVPNFLSFTPSLYIEEQNKIIKDIGNKINCNLYDADNKPLWFIHPKYKRNVDIAVLSLRDINVNLFAITDLGNYSTDLNITDDVFVIGYPLALGTNENKNFPIWKSAVVASEPCIDYFIDGREAFIIDGTTRSGMSGSPVIRYSNFIETHKNDGTHSFGMMSHKVCNFLGIYSGRLRGATTDESFLGVVWKKSLIIEIINAKYRDLEYI